MWGTMPKMLTFGIVLAAFVVVALGMYLLASPYLLPASANNISIEIFSLDPISSNLSATVNVNARSPLIQMDLYMNGTFIGSSNYTSWTSRSMMNGVSMVTRNWSNGSYTMMFFITPKSMSMMSRIHMMVGASYILTMVAVFQNGNTYKATAITHVMPIRMGCKS